MMPAATLVREQHHPPASSGPTLAELHRDALSRLRQAGTASPELDARLLVQHFSGTSATDRIARADTPLPPQLAAAVHAAVSRRVSGEPVHRIIGFREFYGLPLALSPETLEPRPDTEILVDAVLPFARRVAEREGSCRVLDLGTGTGAIALALAAQLPELEVTGVDVSAGALATAKANARSLGLESRFIAIESDWFEKISGSYHVIASNPPYITSSELSTLQSEVRNFDPSLALDGGADGLDPYRVIATCAGQHLLPGGLVAVEIGTAGRQGATEIFTAAGYRLAEARRDLGGHDRVLLFEPR